MDINRIVLIGNGFDLAHGLPTSYQDFITDSWGKVGLGLYESKKEKKEFNNNLIRVHFTDTLHCPYNRLEP